LVYHGREYYLTPDDNVSTVLLESTALADIIILLQTCMDEREIFTAEDAEVRRGKAGIERANDGFEISDFRFSSLSYPL
jgi:hypothetical protein